MLLQLEYWMDCRTLFLKQDAEGLWGTEVFKKGGQKQKQFPRQESWTD